MRGILIDPYTNTVKEVEYSGDYEQIYKLIDCDTFTVAYLTESDDCVFVDDNGLLTLTPLTRFFFYQGTTQPIAGKGLILGQDDEGESIATNLPVEEVRKAITFMSLNEAQERAAAGEYD